MRFWLIALLGLTSCAVEEAIDNDGDGYDTTVDCNDKDAAIRPNIGEACNGVDDNCDGQVDEQGAFYAEYWYPDADGDGFGDSTLGVQQCVQPEGYIAVAGDCNDADRSIRPDADETCDGEDDNCNGVIDLDADNAPIYYEDNDGDGYGNPDISLITCEQPEGYVDNDEDCDDEDVTQTPESVWYADEDSDGFGDPEVSYTRCTQPNNTVTNGDDCDDSNTNITTGVWYADGDLDGYGGEVVAENTCEQPAESVAVGGDCEDGDDTIHPDLTDGCDDIDNDCDGLLDEDCVQ